MNDNLKILLCMDSAAGPIPNSSSWRDNIINSLRSLGYQVHLIQFNKYFENTQLLSDERKKQMLASHIVEEYEMIDKARHYLSNLKEARRMANEGIRRAKNQYTWENRFTTLVNT